MHKIMRMNSDDHFDGAEGHSLVEASLEGGGKLPHGCCNGQCGSCAVQVLSGEFSYLNEYEPKGLLTARQQAEGWVISCMAEPKSDLVVNVPSSKRHPPVSEVLMGQVIDRELLTTDVLRLALRLDRQLPFDFLPGQYIDVILGDEQKRSYSLSTLPNADSVIELHIRNIEGGYFSDIAFNDLKVGVPMQIEGPKGNFFWRSGRRNPMIMIAGGTGFAPIKGMIEEVLSSAPESVIHLYWGGSKPQDYYLGQKVEQWLSLAPNMQYTPILFKSVDGWSGSVGSAVKAVVNDYPDLSSFDVYIAGPPAMVKEGIEVFPAFGLPKEHFFTDAFEFATPVRRKEGVAERFKRLFSKRC